MQESSPGHSVSIVIPVYRGRDTLPQLVSEIEALTLDGSGMSPGGRRFTVTEVLLVWDCGPDDSDRVMHALEHDHPQVRCVWLSRNFGQHAATLAGMASTTAEWVVTMDEDLQHNPIDIPAMLDRALDSGAQLVYGVATNRAPHTLLRRGASQTAKWFARRLLSEDGLGDYTSFRLVEGDIARAVAAYGGQGVYLDVALTWVTRPSVNCPVTLREVDRPSGYSFRRLVSHFGRLVVSSGVRPLRIVAAVGVLSALAGFVMAFYVLWQRVIVGVTVEGWTSVIVAVLVMGGVILLALGVLAEYLSVAVRLAIGRPPYLILTDPALGPHAPGPPTETGGARP